MDAVVSQVQAYFAGRKVLVVGGEGFLAQNAIHRLVALKAEVTMLVREQRRAPPPGVSRLVVGDVREAEVSAAVVAGQQVVLNFAGVTSAVTSNRMPSVSLLIECLPHLTLLDACAAQASPPLVVFPSSRLVYGKPQQLPVDEQHPTQPLTVYGIHKLAVEHYLRVYQRMHGVPYLVLRISNPYGPHQNLRRGYGILNTFIQRALAGQPITLYGDGQQLRDFIHVDDLVSVTLRAIATPACHNDTYNVGGPEAVALADVAHLIAQQAGGTPVLHQPWPEEHLKVETGDYVGNIAKLASRLPGLSFMPLAQGLASAVAAYQQVWTAADQAQPADDAPHRDSAATLEPMVAALASRRVA
jgi:nucleoside-diphosphate-sugar epimerase